MTSIIMRIEERKASVMTEQNQQNLEWKQVTEETFLMH